MIRRQTLNFFLGILMGISLVLISYVVFNYVQKHSFKEYSSAKEKFTMRYPADWTLREDVEGAAVIFFTPLENEFDIFKENVNIIVQEVPEKLLDLEKYTDMAIRQMKAVFKENLIPLDSSKTYLAGLPAYKFVYLGKGPEAELKIMHIWAIKKNKAYQFTYTAISSKFDLYIDDVEKMINSFKIQK